MLIEFANWLSLDSLLAIGVVAAGAMVQSSVGFGFALIAAPILLLLDPRFVPGPLLASSFVLTLLVMCREWKNISWRGVRFAVLGRALGTPPAAWAMAGISARSFDLLFGILVVVAVVLMSAGNRVHPRPISMTFAGLASGFMGTVSSIGGPPLALAFQHEEAKRLRGTLSAIFVPGTILSIVSLFFIGRFGNSELLLSVILIPGVIIGFYTSRLLGKWVTRIGLRRAVLILSITSAAGVLLRGLITE